MQDPARLATFRDSRGLPVPRWPDAVGVGTNAIIWHRDAVLVQQRADNGYWGFPGGRMEVGESVLDCCTREVYEETGLRIVIDRLVAVDSHPAQHAICVYPDGACMQYCCLTFLCRLDINVARHPIPTLSPESTDAQWVTPPVLLHPFLPAHLWRLEQALVCVRNPYWIPVTR